MMEELTTNQTEIHRAELINSAMLVKEDIAPDGIFDIEDHLIKFPVITTSLILINIIVFFWEIATNALDSSQGLINAGAMHKASILQGEYTRFITAMFLHADILHLFGNMIMLYISGIIVESFYKTNQTIVIYFLSGIAGCLLSFLLSPSQLPSVGASGAIFGLIGANIVFFLQNKNVINNINKRVSTVFILFAIFSILTGLSSEMIDNYGHVGGFLGGAIFCLLFKNNIEHLQFTAGKSLFPK